MHKGQNKWMLNVWTYERFLKFVIHLIFNKLNISFLKACIALIQIGLEYIKDYDSVTLISVGTKKTSVSWAY